MRTRAPTKWKCDVCGKRVSEAQIPGRLGREPGKHWRKITFGAITSLQSVEKDIRHVCSFKCARSALSEMITNLQENDPEGA